MQEKSTNRLFPVFIKLERLDVLIVGGGNVALEKLTAILTNAPATRIQLVAKEITSAVRLKSASFSVTLSERAFEEADLKGVDIVFIAIDDYEESARISQLASAAGKLVNVADKPSLCDFYLGSVVQKGNLKIAISTNGMSPTLAKRMRVLLDEVLPDELDELLGHLQQIRDELKGDFASKVAFMNTITRPLAGTADIL
jgi:siroheme synthase-like protein